MGLDFDLIVIGGGINGAGVAQAAAAAGQSVIVLEQYPTLAAGTSSRSSKLIHGGLRYLEGGQLPLVRESLHERAVLLSIAPELVKLTPFHIPVYADSRHKKWQVRAGLSLYALLGGLHRENRFRRLAPSRYKQLDGLSTDGLRAVFQYQDAQTDDGALVRALMASARDLGAELRLRARCEALHLDAGGARVIYRNDGETGELRARAVVNATGPWVNQVLAKASPAQKGLEIELVQGAHLVLPGKLERGIYYVETADGRAIFAMPWRDNILIGTTETVWRDDPAAAFPLDEEIDYLLATFARYFPAQSAERKDIVASFAGLRVLPGGGDAAFKRSREVILVGDKDRRPNLVSIYGGKITSYRATAAKVLRMLASTLPERRVKADTKNLVLEPAD